MVYNFDVHVLMIVLLKNVKNYSCTCYGCYIYIPISYPFYLLIAAKVAAAEVEAEAAAQVAAAAEVAEQAAAELAAEQAAAVLPEQEAADQTPAEEATNEGMKVIYNTK